jgi:hypothetical protein
MPVEVPANPKVRLLMLPEQDREAADAATDHLSRRRIPGTMTWGGPAPPLDTRCHDWVRWATAR